MLPAQGRETSNLVKDFHFRWSINEAYLYNSSNISEVLSR